MMHAAATLGATITNSSVSFNSGNITGQALNLSNSSLNLNGSATGTAAFRHNGGSVNGTIGENTTVTLAGALVGTRTFTSNGSLTNTGELILDQSLGGAVVLDVNGPALTNSPAGIMRGSGTINFSVAGGKLVNEGLIAPRLSPGQLVVEQFQQTSTGSLQMGIEGRIPTEFDNLITTTQITFGGTLDVSLGNGFQPQAGDVFNLFDFGTRTGTFTEVNLPALNPGLLWSQAALYTAGEIQVALDPVFISRTWDGGGANNNWITDNNWTLDVQPLNNATADLIFTGNVRLAPSVDAPWNVHSITFNNAAGAFTITGPQGVTIGTSGIVNNDTQTQTITAAITLSASESFNAAAGDLAISSVALSGQTLTLTGANDIVLVTASGTGTIEKEGLLNRY